MINNIRHGYFKIHEVIHCPLDEFPIDLLPCAYAQAGLLNGFRLDLQSLGDIYITVTSGYRNTRRNASVGGSRNSMHIWRIENGELIAANDFKVYKKTKTTPTDVTKKAFEILSARKTFPGELGYKASQNIIHAGLNSNKIIAPFTY